MFKKFLKLIIRHKIIVGIIIVLLAGAGYYGYNLLNGNKNSVRYTTATVEKGTLVVSVSGSGQISASNQVDVKPKASGDIIYLGVKTGQTVKAGTLLAKLDTTDAEKSLRNAETDLETAKLNLEKLTGPEGLAIPKNKQTAIDNLQKAYDDGSGAVFDAFLDLPAIITGLNSMMFTADKTLNNQWPVDYFSDATSYYDESAVQYKNDINAKFKQAREEYNQNFQDYNSIGRFSDADTVNKLVTETYNTTKAIAEAVKSANNLIQFYENTMDKKGVKAQSIADTDLSTLGGYASKLNGHITNLVNAKDTIKNDIDAISDADFDIRSQNITVSQKEDALLEAKNNLANYYVYAPFDGIAAEVSVSKGDSVSSGATIATLITKQRIAEISLNEVDAAKVKIGQKATLTFDAIEDLSITGEVSEIDAIGTVSQGVVNYNVKIVFDTQNEQVKPGMSVSAAIIIDAKQNVLLIPSAAVKEQLDGSSYVQVMASGTPQNQTVETGLSDDTNTEITSGLQEGDKIITQTAATGSSNTATTKSQNGGGFSIPGLGGGR